MANHGENLLTWLCDAHALEGHAACLLSAQADRIANYPQIRARLTKHLGDTSEHRLLLAGCIDRLGGRPSRLKALLGSVAAFGNGAWKALRADEIVQGLMSIYALESFRVATYTSLIAAAVSTGDVETQRVCDHILGRHKAMATWTIHHIAALTDEFLMRDAAGVEAKG